MVSAARLRVMAGVCISVALIAVVLGLNAAHSDRHLFPGALEYFLALSLPQAAIVLMLRKRSDSVAFAVAAGVAFLMTLFSAAWSAVGYIMATATFGGYRPPNWYWYQWFAGCLVGMVQFATGCFAYASLCRLSSARHAVAQGFGGIVLAFLYSILAFTVLRLIA
jgi:hypothetical protein